MRRPRASALVAATVLVVSGTAHARPPGTTTVEHREPAIALAISAGGTLAGLGLVLGAVHDEGRSAPLNAAAMGVVIVGPSFGHWYAGNALTYGMGARAAGVVGVAVGLIKSDDCSDRQGPGICERDENADVWKIAGLALVAGGTLYDLAAAPRAASEFNRAHELHLVPTALPAAGGPAPGFALTGTF